MVAHGDPLALILLSSQAWIVRAVA